MDHQGSDNYNDMFDKLTKSLSLLATHENHLVKYYNVLDQGLWDTHWFSYNSAVNNTNSNIESANIFYPIAISLILTLLGLHVCLLIISLIIFFFFFLFSPV